MAEALDNLITLGIATAAVFASVFGSDFHDVAPVAAPVKVSITAGDDGDKEDSIKKLLTAGAHDKPKKPPIVSS